MTFAFMVYLGFVVAGRQCFSGRWRLHLTIAALAIPLGAFELGRHVLGREIRTAAATLVIEEVAAERWSASLWEGRVRVRPVDRKPRTSAGKALRPKLGRDTRATRCVGE